MTMARGHVDKSLPHALGHSSENIQFGHAVKVTEGLSDFLLGFCTWTS